MAESEAPVASLSFEAALAELERVVGRLESSEVPLEESIALYSRGAALRAHCEEKLKAAEERVSQITQAPDGTIGVRTVDIPDGMKAEVLKFHAALSDAANRTEAALQDLLPGEESLLAAPIRYAVLSGGKRLRAFLALETAAMFRVPQAQSLRTAAAVECVHAYSLVHDDLPCMDDDDLRRGQPTVHIQWDEATAVLAGDALLTLAFEILAAPSGIDPRVQVRLIGQLAKAAGAGGMVGGQAIDIAAASGGFELKIEEVGALQALKTGALIGWAAESGAILGRSDPTPLRHYAADLGLAFQIQDDILDVEGDPREVGKPLRKDADAGKATFVSVLGLAGAKRRALDLAESACANLAPYGSAADNLRLAAAFAVGRSG